MASPQTEEGFAKIAFELMEAFAHYFPSKAEGQIIWAILRRTYGWDKKFDYISYQQLADDTGLSRRTVIYSLQNLVAKNMVTVIPQNHGTQLNLMGIQKDYDKWTPLLNAPPYQALLNNKKIKYAECGIVAPVQTNDIITNEIVAPVQLIGCTSATNPQIGVQTNGKNVQIVAPTTDIQINQQIITTDIINKPEKKERKSAIKIPDWIDGETWDDFLEVRKKKRAPMTDRAITLMINKLAEFKEKGIDPNKLLEQSILRGYTDVYPLKDNEKKNSFGQKEKMVDNPQLRSAFRDIKGIPSSEEDVCQPN